MVFLQTNGLFVHTAIYELLYLEALTLVQNKDHYRTFKIPDWEGRLIGDGRLETKHQNAVMGTMGGVKFTAEVSIEARQFKIVFIIRTDHLEEYVPGFWSLAAPSSAPLSGYQQASNALLN